MSNGDIKLLRLVIIIKIIIENVGRSTRMSELSHKKFHLYNIIIHLYVNKRTYGYMCSFFFIFTVL